MKIGCLSSALLCVALLFAVSTIALLIDAIPTIQFDSSYIGFAWIIFSILLCPFAFKIRSKQERFFRDRASWIYLLSFTLLLIACFLGAMTLAVRSDLYELHPGQILTEADMEDAMRADRGIYVFVKYFDLALFVSGFLLGAIAFFSRRRAEQGAAANP